MTAKSRTRAGFTLIEVLMVVAIIAVLAALLITAVGKVRNTGRVTTTTNDISQLETAVLRFKTDFNLLPPSHTTITLNNELGGDRKAAAAPAPGMSGDPSSVFRFRLPAKRTEPEFQVFQRMFPRWNPLDSTDPNYNSTTDPRSAYRYQADGVTLDLDRMLTFVPTGATKPPAAPLARLIKLTNPTATGADPLAVPLDPNQVMVLFLGGPLALLTDATLLDPAATVKVEDYGNGWDVSAPTAPSPTAATKKGPYYEFPQARLVPADTVVTAEQLKFGRLPRFVDGWGTPYAYFSASAGESYDPRVAFPWPVNPSGTANGAAPGYYDISPSASITDTHAASAIPVFTAHPYGSNGKWLNPGRFQIISAGPDKMFGPGSTWVEPGKPTFDPQSAAKIYHVWQAKNPQGDSKSSIYYGEGGGSATDANKQARGADDLSNFNAGNNLGTASGG